VQQPQIDFSPVHTRGESFPIGGKVCVHLLSPLHKGVSIFLGIFDLFCSRTRKIIPFWGSANCYLFFFVPFLRGNRATHFLSYKRLSADCRRWEQGKDPITIFACLGQLSLTSSTIKRAHRKSFPKRRCRKRQIIVWLGNDSSGAKPANREKYTIV